MNISLRPALESDIDFLVDLRNATMRDYLEQVGMPISLDDYLNRIQFKFECAQIITLDQVPIGLFKAEYQADQNLWYLIQIQIHPGYQNASIGSTLVKNLIEKAQASQSRVGLSVIKTNPAYQLYQRLGFKKISETEYEYNLELKA